MVVSSGVRERLEVSFRGVSSFAFVVRTKDADGLLVLKLANWVSWSCLIN